ncbi:hypothetical protein HMF8227_01209 [Saliniradius amylolyticus]|uniref:Sulfotransferase family protein n=1 Tax=Saliniradius amylolyticus TaxID=2183582 RepID=A0A2S2E359_9ALTE|nr:sulfotransferase family 2 domain-containing protein [Saliniradius amylolyticus]AWL11690.1 hypothetical protein HMF8227_01209 [Saliniradius amylolyticus]
MTSIDNKLSSLNPDLNFLRSFRTKNRLDKTVFFYHIPKTGGLSFFNTIMLAKQIYQRLCRVQPSFGGQGGVSGRVDSPEQLADFAKKLEQNPAAKCEMIAGHVPFGTHEFLPNDTELMTIIRNPIHRVKSAYQYKCMRSQKKPSMDDFECFIGSPDNQDVMFKQLCVPKDELVEDVGINDWAERIASSFDYIGDISDLKLFQEFYLSRLGLPCVTYERFNQTLPQYKLDLSHYDQLIIENNRRDMDLYQLLRRNRKLPDLSLFEMEPLHGVTAICYELEKEKSSQQTGGLMGTRYLVEQLESNPAQFSDWPSAVKNIVNKGALELEYS